MVVNCNGSPKICSIFLAVLIEDCFPKKKRPPTWSQNKRAVENQRKQALRDRAKMEKHAPAADVAPEVADVVVESPGIDQSSKNKPAAGVHRADLKRSPERTSKSSCGSPKKVLKADEQAESGVEEIESRRR